MNKLIKIVGLVILLATVFIGGYFIRDIPNMDNETLNTLTSQITGILVGVSASYVGLYIKSTATTNMITKMIDNGSNVFDKASKGINQVKESSLEQLKVNKDMLVKLEKVAELGQKIIEVSKKIDIIYKNDPKAIKSGLAREIVKVNNDESESN